ncbi:MAG TPA: hypothetical protein VMT20_07020 [Terriglobia bacterium]|nr:hypothetical protein [Terriglobia bacterium]
MGAHEEAIALMERAKKELERGRGQSGEITASPGEKEARMAAEQGHDGGAGNKTSNKPGSAGAPDRAADSAEESRGSQNLTGHGPVPSAGNRRSALAGPAAASGELADIRRQAALKELEKERSSEGNKESVAPAPAAEGEGRIGEVKAPAKGPPDRNKKAEFEGVPPFAKEPLGGDGWGKAAQKAREMFAAKK